MKYHFEKPTVTRESLEEQLKRVKEIFKRDEQLWAETQPPDPFDDDDLDEIKGKDDGMERPSPNNR